MKPPFLLAMMLAAYSFPQSSSSSNTSNNGGEVFRVFRIFVRTWEDVNAISELRAIAQENQEIDFWLDSIQPDSFADVMISPHGMPLFGRFLDSHPHLEVKITVDDVQKLIIRNEFRPRLQKNSQQWRIRDRRTRRCRRRNRRQNESNARSGGLFDQLRGVNYPFGEYSSYNSMIRFLRTLEFYYPHLVQLIQLGTTHEGRSIEGVKIGLNPELLPPVESHRAPKQKKAKRAFWIDGNVHAREWASGHTALFFVNTETPKYFSILQIFTSQINQLVAGYGKDPFLTNALNRIDFYIVPCANPDGFEFSRSSLNPKIRLWRKNRSPEQCTRTWSGLVCCRGVDLNRNFNFHWAETGSSANACSNLYAGKKVFSEPEARAISDFLMTDELKGRVDAFITLHTYAQMWIHPFSHEYKFYPTDVQKLKSLALRAVSRLKEIYGTNYRVGTGADLLAPASGGSDDWAKESLGVKFVYLVELRPQLDLSNGFILRQEELLPTAIETFEAIKEVIKGVLLENAMPLGLPLPLNATQSMLHQQSSSSTTASLPDGATTTTITQLPIGFQTSHQPDLTQNTTLMTPVSSVSSTMMMTKIPTQSSTMRTTTILFTPAAINDANNLVTTTTTTTGISDSTQKLFTLPWVPTRRIPPPRIRFQLPNRNLSSTTPMARIASSTTSAPLTTVLFTAIQEAEHSDEIALSTQATSPPLLRSASKQLGSDPLDQFSVLRRDKTTGQFTEIMGDNLMALLQEETTVRNHHSSRPAKRCSDEKSSCAFWIRAHPPVCDLCKEIVLFPAGFAEIDCPDLDTLHLIF